MNYSKIKHSTDKGDAISILDDSFPGNLPSIKIISIIQAEIKSIIHTKFHGLLMDNHINWKTHIEQIIPKLSETCYTIRSISTVTLTLSNQFTIHTLILL